MRAAVVVAVLVAAQWCVAEDGTITAQMREADPRLEQPVTLRTDRVYVGELCALLTERSGIEIGANDRDGASDPRVVAVLNDLPVADAMNAIRSLLSYEGAPYLWERSGSAPAYRYTLATSLRARRLPSEISAKIAAEFEAQCADLARLSRLPPSDLERLAKDDPKAASMAKLPREAAAWRMLQDALPPDRLAAVLRGEVTVRLPVADLPPSGRELVKLVWSEGQRFVLTPDGGRAEAPEPTEISISLYQSPLVSAPTLMIDIGRAGGYSYAGGTSLTRRLADGLLPKWVLHGDTRTSPAEQRALKTAPHEADPPNATSAAARSVHDLARAADVSVIVRMPSARITIPPPQQGRTLAAYLAALGERHGVIQHKWCAATLLISYLSWYREEADTLPWRVERAVMRSLARAEGMSFHEVVGLAASITERQASCLAEDHPSLRFLRNRSFYAALAGPSGLAAQALSSRGVQLTGELAAVLRERVGPALAADARAFRIVEKPMTPQAGDHGQITFVAGQGTMWWLEVLGSDGQWAPHSGVLRPREARGRAQE